VDLVTGNKKDQLNRQEASKSSKYHQWCAEKGNIPYSFFQDPLTQTLSIFVGRDWGSPLESPARNYF